MTGEKTFSGLRFWALFLAGLSFAVLVVMLVVVTLHAAWPGDVQVGVLSPLLYITSGSAGASVVLGIFWFLFRYPAHRTTLLLLAMITVGILVAHFYTINQPPTPQCFDNQKYVNGCIMDEIYYVPAAQALLSGEKCGPYLDNCNLEHPFLSKAIIAAGIAIFGDNDFGWRFFEVLLGTASIPIVFGICWSVTRDPRLSLFAAYLLAFETLFFVHSSIAVIDIQMIFFALLAFLVYLADIRIWRLDRVTLAAIMLGLSALSKETAVFMVGFLVVYNLFFGTGGKVSRMYSSARMLVIVALIFIAGLQLYVTLFGNSSMHSFVDDIRYILDYGASLKTTPTSQGWIDSVLGTPITPFNWMTYYSAIGYFVTRVSVSGSAGYSYVALGYWGVTNFFEVWLTFLWAPYVAYLGYKRWIAGASSAAAVEEETVEKPPPAPKPTEPRRSQASRSPSWSATLRLQMVSVVILVAAGISYLPELGRPLTPYLLLADIPFALTTLLLMLRWDDLRHREFTGVTDAPSVPVPVSPASAPVVLEAPPEPALGAAPEPEQAPDSSFALGRFAFLWYVFAYFPYIALFFYGRVTYPYYILPAMPAISIGCAYLFTRKWFPREVAYVILAGVFLWFFLYYPDKSFLPTQLRTILGH
ncbi:MAG: glycosyltransferase family 39 protein [Nitrososphaerales archaeon]|jgi:hypothetical protein